MRRLIPLGTSAGHATLFRNITANLIEMDNGNLILIDCGDGILNSLVKLGFDLKRIEMVLITHLHSDHVGGIISLLFNWVLGKCDVYLPEEGIEIIETFKKVSKTTINEQVHIHELPKKDEEIIKTLSNGIEIKLIQLPHTIPSYGFVLKDTKGLTVCVLGDTSGRDLSFLKKVHVLVHECTFKTTTVVRYGHSNPEIAGKCAETVNADYLLLNHFSDQFCEPQQFEEIAKETQGFTKAEVVILSDFQPFDLSSILIDE